MVQKVSERKQQEGERLVRKAQHEGREEIKRDKYVSRPTEKTNDL